MSFRIDNTNIDHIMSIGDTKYNKDKKRIINELHFNKNKCTPRLIQLLKRVWW